MWGGHSCPPPLVLTLPEWYIQKSRKTLAFVRLRQLADRSVRPTYFYFASVTCSRDSL
jgi:hypothetical protein